MAYLSASRNQLESSVDPEEGIVRMILVSVLVSVALVPWCAFVQQSAKVYSQKAARDAESAATCKIMLWRATVENGLKGHCSTN